MIKNVLKAKLSVDMSVFYTSKCIMLPSRIRMIVDYTRSFCMNFNVTTLTRRFCCECHDRQIIY